MVQKILVVDDDKNIRDIVVAYLTKEGYTVISAENGVQALALAKQACPAIILADSMMPQMDGLDLCRAIRQDIQLANVFFVMLTGKSSTHDALDGYAAGVDEYLTKPFNNQELMARIRAFSRIVMLKEQLQTRERELSDLMNNLAVGIMLIDPDTQLIVEVNPFAVQLIGSSREEIIGHHCRDFMCAGRQGSCPLLQTECQVENAECTVLTADRTVIPVFKTVRRTVMHEKMLFIESFVDIRYLKAMEQEKLAAIEQTTQLELEQKKIEGIIEVGGTLCHEINQPLTTLMGHLEIMRNRIAPEQDEMIKRVNKISQSAERMADITRRLNKILRKKEFIKTEYLADGSGRQILDIYQT